MVDKLRVPVLLLVCLLASLRSTEAFFDEMRDILQELEQSTHNPHLAKSLHSRFHARIAEESRASAKSTRDYNQLRDFITSFMECQQLPGLTVTIVEKGQVVFMDGFGVRDVDTQTPVNNETLFGIGSTSKAFTSMLTGILRDRGQLDWDEKVSSYLPGWELLDPTANELVTVRDLLSHRTGLPRHDMSLFQQPHDEPREEIVFKARYLSPSEPIRAEWQYNNWMVTVAGFLAAHLNGTYWEEMVHREVFEPLGMSHSKANFTEAVDVENKAIPASFADGKYTTYNWSVNLMFDGAAPAGGVLSNNVDMAKWLLLHLGSDKVPRIVSDDSLLGMHSRSMVTTVYPPAQREVVEMMLGTSYGLAWFLSDYRGFRRVFHGGDVEGLHSMVSLFPDEEIGFFFSMNAVNPGRYWRPALAAYISDFMLGIPPLTPNVTAACAFPCTFDPEWPRCPQSAGKSKVEEEQEAAPHADVDVTQYEGVFRNPGYGTAELTAVDNSTLQLVFGNIVRDLIYLKGEVFAAQGLGAQAGSLTFWRDNHLRVVAFTLFFADDVVYNVPFTNHLYNPAVLPLAGQAWPFLSDNERMPCFPSGVGLDPRTTNSGGDDDDSRIPDWATILIAIVAGILVSAVTTVFVIKRVLGVGASDSYVAMSSNEG